MRVYLSAFFAGEMIDHSGEPLDILADRCYCSVGVKESSGSPGTSKSPICTTWTPWTSCCRPPLPERNTVPCPCHFSSSNPLGERRELTSITRWHRHEGRWVPYCQYDRSSARVGNRAELPWCGGGP